jgi:hypothetical protein
MPQSDTIATPSSVEILARLVAFVTASYNSNLDLIGFVGAWLDLHEVRYRLSVDPSGTNGSLKASLYCAICSCGA